MPSAEKLLLQAEGFLELELPREALRQLQRIEIPDRGSFPYLSMMGEVHRALKMYAEAIPFLEKALRINPEAIETYLCLAWCLKRTDQLNRAIHVTVQAEEQCRRKRSDSSVEDSHALVMYNLSCYYALSGQREMMLEWLGKALKKRSGYRKLIAEETDFNQFRHDPEFERLASDETEVA